MHIDHLFADYGGIAAAKLADQSLLSSLLLAAANAAGLSPSQPPLVTRGAPGISAVLLCHGGHVAMLSSPDEGLCFVDIAVADGASGAVRRAGEIIMRRLRAKEIRTDVKRRGPVTGALS